MEVSEELERLTKKITELENERSTILSLLEKYPDLSVHIGRFDERRYISISLRPTVTDFYAKHSCGCCNDSSYLICPFLEINGVHVYSDAPICIGSRDPNDGLNDWGPNWEEKFVGYNEEFKNKLRLLYQNNENEKTEYLNRIEEENE